jgi:ABC-type multidrug transport system permease subunit
VLLGSLVATPEGVQGIAFIVIFPITFIASTFVPTSTLPSVLRTIAEWNPTSSLANALRHLFGNPGGIAPPGAAWPLAHPIAYTLLWAAAIVLVCAPLAVAQYQRSIRS